MRDYGKVFCKFWESRDMRSLTEDGRYLALYLMTCRHCTLAGIFRLPDGYVCSDMQWTSERVAKVFGELLRKGFAIRCPDTDWVWITKYLDWNGTDNPNQRKAAAKVVTEVPTECCWLTEFQEVFDAFIDSRGKGFRNRWRTPSEPLRNPSAGVTEPLANPSPTHSNPGSGSVSGSVSGAVSVTGAVCVRREGDAATGEDAVGEHAGDAGGNVHLNGKGNGNGADTHSHDPPEPAEPHDPAAPKSFATLREIYPTRSGSQRWADALANYTANLKAGYSHHQMLDGVIRYARYCRIEDILGRKEVQTAATFLGPNHGFLEPWTPSTKRETPGERWLRNKQQEAKDAAR